MAVPAILKIDSRDSCTLRDSAFRAKCWVPPQIHMSCSRTRNVELWGFPRDRDFYFTDLAKRSNWCLCIVGSCPFSARKRVQPKIHLSGCRRQVTRFVHHLVVPMVKPSRCQEHALFVCGEECVSCSRSPVKNCRSAIHCRRPTRRHTRKQQKRSASGIRCGVLCAVTQLSHVRWWRFSRDATASTKMWSTSSGHICQQVRFMFMDHSFRCVLRACQDACALIESNVLRALWSCLYVWSNGSLFRTRHPRIDTTCPFVASAVGIYGSTFVVAFCGPGLCEAARFCRCPEPSRVSCGRALFSCEFLRVTRFCGLAELGLLCSTRRLLRKRVPRKCSRWKKHRMSNDLSKVIAAQTSLASVFFLTARDVALRSSLRPSSEEPQHQRHPAHRADDGLAGQPWLNHSWDHTTKFKKPRAVSLRSSLGLLCVDWCFRLVPSVGTRVWHRWRQTRDVLRPVRRVASV